MTKQDEILAFINDPENINKAVEGSMEKRLRVINPEQTAIDAVLTGLSAYSNKTALTDQEVMAYFPELQEAKAKIERLIAEARVAELKRLQDSGHAHFTAPLYIENRIASLTQPNVNDEDK